MTGAQGKLGIKGSRKAIKGGFGKGIDSMNQFSSTFENSLMLNPKKSKDLFAQK